MPAANGFQYITGKTCYVLIRSPNASEDIWNGSAFETYNNSNYATYVISAVEQGLSGFYVYNVPSLPAGTYDVVAMDQLGGSPSQSDLPAAGGTIDWTGTATSSTAAAIVASIGATAIAQIQAALLAVVNVSTLTEGYRAFQSPGSLAQLLYELIGHMGNTGIVGTTKTITPLNQIGAAKTYNLDSASSPTAIEEAS